MNHSAINLKKILLVEDDQSLVNVLRKKIERRGYAVEVYSKGQGLIPKALEASPDLILLGLSLADMDGLDALTELKNNPDTQNIPVIMLNNLDMTSPKALKKFDSYLSKIYLVKSSWTLWSLMRQIDKTLA